MSALADQVVEYLALRRSLGFALVREEQMLGQFVAYLEAAGAGNVRSELAIAWAQLPATASPNHWAKRLGVVRRFAVYLRTIEETTEVPPPGVFPTTPAPASSPTCSPNATSNECSRPPERSPHRFARRRTRRSSDCSRPPACGSAKRSVSPVATSTSAPA